MMYVPAVSIEFVIAANKDFSTARYRKNRGDIIAGMFHVVEVTLWTVILGYRKCEACARI